MEEITGIERRTIQDYKTVADRVSTERHAELGFSHHREVAKLEPEKQKEFLDQAVQFWLSFGSHKGIVSLPPIIMSKSTIGLCLSVR